MTVRVVVADDQTAVREGLATVLGLLEGIEVVGQAGDGEAAVALVASSAPDVVLMDLRMPVLDGVGATARIVAEHPATRVVVLTTFADDASILGALRAGALGFLTKDASSDQIGQAVHAAAAGQSLLDPEVQRRLVAAASGRRRPVEPTASLTAREQDVLRLIAAGRSNREIARGLFVSEATVKTHVNHLFAKTGVRDRAQAVRYAVDHGLADG